MNSRLWSPSVTQTWRHTLRWFLTNLQRAVESFVLPPPRPFSAMRSPRWKISPLMYHQQIITDRTFFHCRGENFLSGETFSAWRWYPESFKWLKRNYAITIFHTPCTTLQHLCALKRTLSFLRYASLAARTFQSRKWKAPVDRTYRTQVFWHLEQLSLHERLKYLFAYESNEHCVHGSFDKE